MIVGTLSENNNREQEDKPFERQEVDGKKPRRNQLGA